MNSRTFRRSLLIPALLAAATAAQAGPAHESLVRARVISSVPVYQTINQPRTECWTDTVAYEVPRHEHDGGGAVLGAIAGGLIGSTVGKGNGRVAAAAVGAATGAVIGDRLSDHRRYGVEAREVERCRSTDAYRRVLSGYDVRYRYQGQDYSTQLPYDPGRFIKLRVSVAVADDQGGKPERGARDRYDHYDWNAADYRDERDDR